MTYWKCLHEDLKSSIRRQAFDRAFERATKRQPALQGFGGPQALVATLATKGGDLKKKDRVLRALIVMVQKPESTAARRLGENLLLLGLWPGLDALYRRLQRGYADTDPGEIISAILHAITGRAGQLKLDTTVHVSAALVDWTEHAARKALNSARKRESRHVEFKESGFVDEIELDEASTLDHPMVDEARVEAEIEALRVRLFGPCGPDVELLISIAIVGETQAEAARRLGAHKATTYFRYRRALAAARKYFLKYS